MLAFVPGILMVLMLGLIFIYDIFSQAAVDEQFEFSMRLFRVFDYISIAAGLVYLGYAYVNKKLRFDLRDYLFGGFLLCIFISTVLNGLNHDSAFGIPYRYIGVFNMFAFFIIYMKVSGYIEKPALRYNITTLFIAASDLIAISCIYHAYFGVITAYLSKADNSTIFVNSNHYGYFIAMAILLSAGYFVYEDGWKAIVGAVSAVLNIAVLAINNTLGAMIAVGVCMLVMIILVLKNDPDRRKRALCLTGFLVLCAAGGMVLVPSIRVSVVTMLHDIFAIIGGTATGDEGTGRLLLWETAISYIKEKPLFGFGCEGITRRMLEATGIGDAHCELITYAAYYGIPGMLLYLSGVIAAAVSYFKYRSELPVYCRIAFLAASGYFISSFFGVPMFNTTPFFFIFMGMARDEWKPEAEGSNQ